MNLIYFLLIGLLAGWLAGLIMKGRGFGLIGNLVLGVVGAALAFWLTLLHDPGGIAQPTALYLFACGAIAI